MRMCKRIKMYPGSGVTRENKDNRFSVLSVIRNETYGPYSENSYIKRE